MSHGTAEVNEAARGQEDDVFAVGELVTVDLRLDVGLVDAVVIQPLDIDLAIKMPNVADDGVVSHLHENLKTRHLI